MRTTLVSVTLMAALGVTTGASARTNCEFIQVGDTQTLRADCETDETLFIPIGTTWDGAGFRITAVDPPGGHFTGAIVRNAGKVAHIRNLTVDAHALAAVCDTDAAMLRGILFESASGSIQHSRAVNINQGTGNGCQEGHGIEARNPPYDGSHGDTQHVTIAGNRVEGYQKTGILVNGDVVADVAHNRVVGFGPVDFIGQNGIQIGYGATARVRSNHVEGNSYTGGTWGSAGILLLHAGEQVEVQANHVSVSDVGIWLSGTSAASVSLNSVRDSVREAVLIESFDSPADGNYVGANWLAGGRTGISVYGLETTSNEIAHNLLHGQQLSGVQVVDASDTVVEHNKIVGRGEYGVLLIADGNEVSGNWIGTSGVGIHVEGDDNLVRWNVVHARSVALENSGTSDYLCNHRHDPSGVVIDCPRR